MLIAFDDWGEGRDLHAAVGRFALVHTVQPTEGDVRRTLKRVGTNAVVVLSPSMAGLSLTLVSRLREAFPEVPIVASAPGLVAQSPLGRAFARAGGDDILSPLTENLTPDLQRTVAERLRWLLPSGFFAAVLPTLEPAALRIVQYVFRNMYRPLSVEQVDHWFGYAPRARRELLSKAGLPALTTLRAVARATHVAAALDRTGNNARRLSEDLEFGSVCNLRMFLKRAAGLTLPAMQARGPLDVAADVVRRAIGPLR